MCGGRGEGDGVTQFKPFYVFSANLLEDFNKRQDIGFDAYGIFGVIFSGWGCREAGWGSYFLLCGSFLTTRAALRGVTFL